MFRKIAAFLRWWRSPTKSAHSAPRVKGHPIQRDASQARLRQDPRKPRGLTATERTRLKRSLTEQVKSLSPKEIAAQLRRMEHLLEETKKTGHQMLERLKADQRQEKERAKAEQQQVFSRITRDCAKLEREVEAARRELRGAKSTIAFLRAALRTESGRAASDLREAMERLADAKRLCALLESELAAARLAGANEGEAPPVATAQNDGTPSFTEEQLHGQAYAERQRSREDKLTLYEARWTLLLMEEGKIDENSKLSRPSPGNVSFLEFPWPTFETPTLGCPTSGPDSPFSKNNIVDFLNSLHNKFRENDPLLTWLKMVRGALLRFHPDKRPAIAYAPYPQHSKEITDAMDAISVVLTDIMADARRG